MQSKITATKPWQKFVAWVRLRPISFSCVFAILIAASLCANGKTEEENGLLEAQRLGWREIPGEYIHCENIPSAAFYLYSTRERTVEVYYSRQGAFYASSTSRENLARGETTGEPAEFPSTCQKISQPSRIEEI